MTKIGSSRVLFLSVVFLLSASSLAAKSMSENISPWDEMYHLSYIQYVYDGHLPQPGDPLNTWSREGFSCKPVYPFGRTTDVPCGEIADPYRYPEGGSNSATGWPPVYYLTVAALLKVPMIFESHPIAYSRLITAFLWAAGVALIAYASLKRHTKKSAVLSISLVISSLPFAFFHASFITPHAMIPLLLGGILLIDEIRDRRAWGIKKSCLVLLGTGFVASMTVPHFSPIIVIFGLKWASTGLPIGNLGFRNRIRQVGTTALASSSAFITYRIWAFVQDGRALNWSENINVSAGQAVIDTPWTREAIMDSIWRFVPHAVDRYQFLGPVETFMSQSWSYFLIAGIGALIFGSSSELKNIALALVVVGIVYSLYMERMAVAPVPARYGLSLVLLGFSLIPNIMKSRRISFAVLAAAVCTYAYCFNLVPFALS